MFEFNLITKAHYVFCNREKYPKIYDQLREIALN